MSRSTNLSIKLDGTSLTIDLPNGKLLDHGLVGMVNQVKEYSGFEAIIALEHILTTRTTLSLNELVFISDTLSITTNLYSIDGFTNYREYKDSLDEYDSVLTEEEINNLFYVKVVVYK